MNYIRERGDREEAIKRMGWSFLAIFVIVSLWGLVYFLRGVLGVREGNDVAPDILVPTASITESFSVRHTITLIEEALKGVDGLSDREVDKVYEVLRQNDSSAEATTDIAKKRKAIKDGEGILQGVLARRNRRSSGQSR